MVLSTGVVFFSTLLYFVEKDEKDTPFTSVTLIWQLGNHKPSSPEAMRSSVGKDALPFNTLP